MLDDPFHVAVAQWIDGAKDHMQDAYRRTVEDALARVKELTPVKTGYLRANWTVIKAGDAMPIASAAGGIDSTAVVAALKLSDAAVIVNPVVYARRVEYGFVGFDSLHRYYNQPGRHMMTQTIAELPEIAAKAVLEVEQKK